MRLNLRDHPVMWIICLQALIKFDSPMSPHVGTLEIVTLLPTTPYSVL